jgi:uncharacterized transporter YbjL
MQLLVRASRTRSRTTVFPIATITKIVLAQILLLVLR